MPIVVGGIIAAAGAVGGAAIVAHSAGKAADQQAAAGERAIAELKPYNQIGTEAFQTLGGLMGLGGGGGGAAPAGPEPNTPWGGTVTDSMKHSGAITNPAIAPDASYGMHGDIIGMQTTPQQRAAMPTASSYDSAQTRGSAPQATGGMLKVRTPDGRVVQVPVEKAGEAQQNGGVVLGRA